MALGYAHEEVGKIRLSNIWLEFSRSAIASETVVEERQLSQW